MGGTSFPVNGSIVASWIASVLPLSYTITARPLSPGFASFRSATSPAPFRLLNGWIRMVAATPVPQRPLKCVGERRPGSTSSTTASVDLPGRPGLAR